VRFGIEIAAYSSMVDWDSCAYLLFSKAEGIFCRCILQVGEQFLSGSFCYCGGAYTPDIILCVYFAVFVLYLIFMHPSAH
jgi:hypothetical protein